jgi:hypothetical protein
MGFYERWIAESERSAPQVGPTIAEVRMSTSACAHTVAVKVRDDVLKSDKKNMSDLPAGCPLLGCPVPIECRFEPKFFKRMTQEGVLTFGGPCPLRDVCRLN